MRKMGFCSVPLYIAASVLCFFFGSMKGGVGMRRKKVLWFWRRKKVVKREAGGGRIREGEWWRERDEQRVKLKTFFAVSVSVFFSVYFCIFCPCIAVAVFSPPLYVSVLAVFVEEFSG